MNVSLHCRLDSLLDGAFLIFFLEIYLDNVFPIALIGFVFFSLPRLHQCLFDSQTESSSEERPNKMQLLESTQVFISAEFFID